MVAAALLLSALAGSAMIRVAVAPDGEDAKTGGETRQEEKAAATKEEIRKKLNKSSLEKYRERQARLKLQQDTIPDSLLNPRWKIQKTVPVTYDDLKQGPADLKRPDNIKQEVEYNDTLDRYVIGIPMCNK